LDCVSAVKWLPFWKQSSVVNTETSYRAVKLTIEIKTDNQLVKPVWISFSSPTTASKIKPLKQQPVGDE